MGRLADKFGRLLVLRVQVIAVILSVVLPCANLCGDGASLLFILGAAGFTLHPVAMARPGEKVEHHQPGNEPALLLSYTVGSLLAVFAAIMQNYSDNLLFIMIASVSFIYLLMLLRNAAQTPNPVAQYLISLLNRMQDVSLGLPLFMFT